MQNEQNKKDIAKLAELIKGIRITMLTTEEADGTLRSRPMATQSEEFDGTLWFFTDDTSPKVGEIEQNRRVNLSYADPSHQRYVSVSGRAEIVHDKAKAKELWNPAYKAWFPEGLDDPKLGLLKVTVESAEYWDSPGSAVVHLFGVVKAVVTGKRAEGGENEKIELR